MKIRIFQLLLFLRLEKIDNLYWIVIGGPVFFQLSIKESNLERKVILFYLLKIRKVSAEHNDDGSWILSIG